MNGKVFGVLGIKAIMANWNADFSGYPKSISTGETFGSDKAFKYPMKKMWETEGENVLYIKSFKIGEDNKEIRPRSLKERYEMLFQVKDLKKEKDQVTVLRNLFSAIDVKNFGATFAEADNNISITGAVQFGQGFNKYKDMNVEVQDILSPFRVDKGENTPEAKQSTLGSKIVSDEAHYVYPFAITPAAYQNFIEMGVTEGYSEEDYEQFKRASLLAATGYNTNTKMGCENELGVFIRTADDTSFPDLAQYVTFEKGEEGEKDTIRLGFDELVNSFGDRVESIEIYYNPFTTVLEESLEGAKRFNIFTMKEV